MVQLTDTEKINKAIECALENGWIDGSHHKMWCIDQMLRILCGDKYKDVVKDFCNGEDGHDTYEWDTGTPG